MTLWPPIEVDEFEADCQSTSSTGWKLNKEKDAALLEIASAILEHTKATLELAQAIREHAYLTAPDPDEGEDDENTRAVYMDGTPVQ